ncbi:nucleobindin-2-like [Xenopus tropicalis]|uniref:Nucleobindin-2-like n=1 Tax=Xenopus tropicalis TaxID=8364 RepID=A0A8J1JVH3_XENTR|nr:nucleobindin-2-like [Xenopus tropicalis]
MKHRFTQKRSCANLSRSFLPRKPAGRGTSEHEQLQQQQIVLDAQKKEYQQAVMQMEQKKAQQTGAEAAAGPNGELKFQPEAPHAESEHGKSRQTDICSDRT